MQSLKTLSWVALAMAFAQIVFGAIVRITGSGMGCGDHWPKCNGAWLPPLSRPDLVIEITHRYIALSLSIVVVALLFSAFRRRREPGVGGKGGVLRPATVAAVLVVVAALLGAITVKLSLNPLVIAAHLTIAMALLGTLALALFRAGGLGAMSDFSGATPKTLRSARAAVVLALVTLALGALTANLPDAAASCGGFPLCRTINARGVPLTVHIVHRIVAILLVGHLVGIAVGVSRRHEPATVVLAARVSVVAAALQIMIAAAMIEMGFPAVLRSFHQAAGTFVWLAVVVLAIVSAHAATSQPEPERMRAAA